jgi:hypothetical protein
MSKDLLINGIAFSDCEYIVNPDATQGYYTAPKEEEVKITAAKDDKKDGKISRRYIHPRFKDAVGLAMEAGEKKYGKFNFLKGHTVLQLLDAAERHIDDYRWGQDNDIDCSSRINRDVSHLGNAAACINMILAQMAEGTITDDRVDREEVFGAK